ncbi:MAG: serine/threonine-protein kinase [Ktedonobacteraceae bacterium]
MGLEQIGKYELLACLGQGGMGEVWKARDTQLRRHVAIKLLHADLQANPDFVAHFLREAQFVASLRHPNIVQVHDFQLMNTQGSSVKAYMVMDYIEGGTLADYIRNTVRKGFFLSAADSVYLFTAISLALDYAHQKGMIHRDIKPANILLDRTTTADAANNTLNSLGEPILSDFGIARLQGAGSSTITRDLIGTPLYISPEQAQGHAVNERSDLYSLGIVLYEIMTGVTPFRGDNAIAIMMQHMYEKPAPPEIINPNISPALSAVILQSIARDPDARFSSGAAMTAAIAQALNLPVPAILSKPGSMNEQVGYNPLQPVTGVSDGHSDGRYELRPYTAAAPVPLRSERSRRSGRYELRPYTVAVVAGVLLLLIGIGAFTALPRLFSQHATATPTSPIVIVGRIGFIHSANAPRNTFDQLKIDLEHIAPPRANTAYYAWLVNSNSPESAFPPHWLLQFSNGSIHSPPNNYSDPNYPDLYTQNDQFLITDESLASTPIVPGKAIYYAIISHTSSASPTFAVRQCPASSSNSSAGPCH